MKKIGLLFLIMLATSQINAQKKVSPIIDGFGTVFLIPNATVTPDLSLQYKIIVDIPTAAVKPDTINIGLEAAITLLNLHGAGGVPANQIKLVLAIHKDAGVALLNNDAYQERFKVDNPNKAMVEALQKAGVTITICGQTMQKRKIAPEALLPGIQIATSAMTTLTTYQLKGYAVMKF
jgi:intracellular sulfur oxidation DsrE/DsrF family protein